MSPAAIHASKRLCIETVDLDAAAALAREAELQLEAVQAATMKRPAVYGDE